MCDFYRYTSFREINLLQRKIFQYTYYKFKVIDYYFEPNFTESLKRNELRQGKEKIPDVGIKSTMKKLEMPTLEEGFTVQCKNN